MKFLCRLPITTFHSPSSTSLSALSFSRLLCCFRDSSILEFIVQSFCTSSFVSSQTFLLVVEIIPTHSLKRLKVHLIPPANCCSSSLGKFTFGAALQTGTPVFETLPAYELDLETVPPIDNYEERSLSQVFLIMFLIS